MTSGEKMMTETTGNARARRHAARRILMSLALLLVAVTMPLLAQGAQVTVEIRKFAFSPKELTVPIGTTVVWTNRDETPHMIADRGKRFVSKAMDTDDSYSFTFTQPGDYSYLCTMHPFMTGVVHVSK
jgi:plastocyanin